MNQPIVSVVVATYRRDSSLTRALNSLTEQTYTNLEIVLVDDNAQPEWNRTINEIAAVLREKNPNILFQLIINEVNQGSAQTRNIGIRAAKGKYITFLDDDDIYLPQKIQKQLTAMQECDADYCITDLYLYDETERLTQKRIRSNYLVGTSLRDLLRCHLMHHMTGTDTMMFRKEYLLKIGCFPLIDLGDEFYLMEQAIEGEGRFCYLPGCDVKAYVHQEGGMSSGNAKISGENQLYEYKQTHFDCLDGKAIRYIKMRHHAVLAFAYLKAKRYSSFFLEGVKALFCDPISCIQLVIKG